MKPFSIILAGIVIFLVSITASLAILFSGYWLRDSSGQQTTASYANVEDTTMNQNLQNRIVRLSKVTVDPESLDTYLSFALECGKRSMAEEPGVIFMYSMSDKKQPNLITILEIYADQAAYEKHIQTAHFQKYKQGTLSMVQHLELLDQNALIPEMRMK